MIDHLGWILGDFGQSLEIDDLRRRIAAVQASQWAKYPEMQSLAAAVFGLQLRQQLILQLLIEKGLFTAEELAARIALMNTPAPEPEPESLPVIVP